MIATNQKRMSRRVQLSAKGAKCKSLGHRPRTGEVRNSRALKARHTSNHSNYCEASGIFRAFSAVTVARTNLGRCPRLLHFAPLALKAVGQILQFRTPPTIKALYFELFWLRLSVRAAHIKVPSTKFKAQSSKHKVQSRVFVTALSSGLSNTGT